MPTGLLGYRDNKPEVPLDELLAGNSITLLGSPGEVYLLLVGQELSLADSGEVTWNKLRHLCNSILALNSVCFSVIVYLPFLLPSQGKHYFLYET